MALSLLLPLPITGVANDLSPTVEVTTGLVGRQAQVTWTGQPGVRYRVQESPTLSPPQWSDRALVEVEGTAGVWLDPESAGPRDFYRVLLPQPEVFSVSPPVIPASGGLIHLYGQLIPPGSQLMLEMEGAAPVFAPLQPIGTGVWQASIVGGFVPGGAVISASIVDGSGETVCPVGQTFEITVNGLASEPAPFQPHAAPVPDAASNPIPGVGVVIKRNPGAGSARVSNSALPGEVTLEQCDLALAVPAGPRLAWIRTYRSKGAAGGSGGGAAGAGWAHCYDVRIEPVPATAGVNAPRIYLFGGEGRRDVLIRQPDGTYRCDGMFRAGHFNPDTSFTLTFADKGTWTFSPLAGTPSPGRLGSIVDRNGVGLTLSYNPAGQLTGITSQFGQSLAVAYTPEGRVQTLTDHTGRFVQYSYFAAGEPGGSPGDLKSVSCPQVAGQPAVAGDTSYSYTTGFADDELNHNLLAVHDGAGRLMDEFTYTSEANPAALEYDACASSRGQSRTGHISILKREAAPPSYPSRSYVCFENDPLGRVTESVFDAQHRCISVREFTGFATPGEVVTSSSNRPTGKLRSTDPDYFETTYLYNGQHLCTRMTEADGTQHRITYDGDLRPDCPVRERANARVVTLRAPNGEERTITFAYQPDFGTIEWPELKASDGKKHFECTAKFQPQNLNNAGGGGKAQGSLGQKAKAWMVNNFEVHPVFGLKTDWITSIGLPKITPKIAKESHGMSRLGSFQAPSYEVEDVSQSLGPDYVTRRLPIRNIGSSGEDGVDIALRRLPIRNLGSSGEDGVDIAMRSIKQGHYAVSNFHAEIDGGGGGGGSLGLVCGNPVGGLTIKGGRNPGGMVTRMLTSHGQVFTWTYDAGGNCTSSRTPIAGGGMVWTYNALGQCTSSTVLNGAGSSFQTTATFDAATQFWSSIISDPAGLQITVSVDRDPLGRITRFIDERGFDWLCDYNPLDDPVQSSTPAVGSSRISTTYFHDAAGYLARCDVEHRDASGALVAANPAYSTFYVYDERGQLVRVATEERPVDAPTVPPLLDPTSLGIENFAVCDLTLDDAGQCVRLSTPAASRGQATDAVCDFVYDERGLLYRGISGGLGALTSVTTQLDYDAIGAVTRQVMLPAVPPPPPAGPNPEDTWTYDPFHRVASHTDPMGNLETYTYDEQGFVTVSLYGEVNDQPGSSGNVLLASGKARPGRTVIVTPVNDPPTYAGRFNSPLLKPEVVRLKEVEIEDPVLELRRFRPAFFDVFVADDVWTLQRFAPGGPSANETTTIARSPAGLVQSVTRNGDTLLACAYDTAGRRYHCSDGSCAVSDTLDAAGRVISSTRTDSTTLGGVPPKTFTQTASYDALGRLTSIADSAGSSTSQECDSLGRTVRVTDPLGVATVCRWDSEDSTSGAPRFYKLIIAADSDADGTDELLRRIDSRSGECRGVTNANGYETTFTRDALGRVTRCDSPDGTFETFAFDAYGRCHESRRQDGTVRTSTFDLNDRVTSATWTLAPGSPAEPVAPAGYQYDGLNRMVACDQGASHLAWSFDSLGNALSETQNAHTFTRTFNHRGRTGITYPGGAHFGELRNAHGELLACSMLDAVGSPISPPVVTMVYLGHRVLRTMQANGVVTDHTYRGDGDAPVPGPGGEDFSFDACVRTVVTDPLGVMLCDNTFNRDRAQRVIRSENAFAEGPPTERPLRRKLFTIDRLGRVTRCITRVRALAGGGPLVTESDVTYTLDLEGNRLTTTGGQHPGAYSLDDAIPPGDRQMNQYTAWPGGPLGWDDNGCLTAMSDGSARSTLVYDACARLVAVNDATTGDPIATYAYDGAGRRIRSTVGGGGLPPVNTFFIHDGDMCVQELNDNGEAEMTFVTGGTGLRHCISTKNGTFYYPNGGGIGAAGHKSAEDLAIRIIQDGNCEEGEFQDIIIDMKDQSLKRILGTFTILTASSGAPIERMDLDDAGRPIFLTGEGIVRPGATDTLSGYRWTKERSRCWAPETGFHHGAGSVYSPQLGQEITAPKKKEYIGHVTLMK